MQQVIKSYDSNEFIECVQTKEITTNASELMNDTLSASLPFDETIKDASYIAVNNTKSKDFSLYRILTAKDEDNLLSFEAINFAVDELDNFIIKDIRPKNRSFSYVINQLLSDSGCDWVLGVCEPIKTVSSTFYYTSMREALKALQELGAEFTFSIEIAGNKITKKIIHCYNQIGKITNKRFEYGDDVLKIVHQQDRTNIVTALIGRGKGEEVGDGYGRRIEFSDVEWKKSNGKPLDKPKGQNWIEYPEMTKEYGIPSNGKMLPRKIVVVFDDVEDASELLQKTYDQLAYYCRPLVQFSTEILGSDSIGNTVSIHRGERNYHYQTRVFKVVTDHVNGRVQASLGDNLSGNSINRQLSQVQSNISDLDSNKMTWYDSTEIGKYQDDIMRGAGANGGSIYMVNGIEAGVSQSRETYEQVFMDGPKIQDSQYFMIQNNAGISFKQCKKGQWTTIQDVHNGKSNTAWTLDGTFNANFINAGVLQGVKIRSINDDFIIELDQGKIRFIKRNGSSENEMFAFAPTYTDGQLQGINAIQNQGYSFALSSKGNSGTFLNVLEIPKDSTADNRKLKLYGEVSVDGSLSINGEKVIPGQNGGGGGGGTGGYPPEVTTDADKFAWDAWYWLISNGYSKQAAAGILGNIQGEAGSSMNPDIDQVGGPGYGIVQWDGSDYPLIGSPTWDGREYVQRLMAAAGIKSDYKTMEAQIRLVNWCMYNGQWIGAVDPTSVEGFKTSTDPKQAAYAFEKNFERPATAHSERQGYSQAWYDKFKDLKPSQNTGEKGLEHLKAVLGQRIGNGQCYGLSAEYSGFLGGCGLGAGTQYGLSHVSGNGSTSAAADIGIAYNWSEVGWKVIKNPEYKDLVVGAIMNYARGGHVGSWYADDTYGHTGIIRGLENGKIQTYEQNTEKGQICAELEREFYSSSDISSICIPPN
nr:phage tail spike protein [Lactococcus lactis]